MNHIEDNISSLKIMNRNQEVKIWLCVKSGGEVTESVTSFFK